MIQKIKLDIKNGKNKLLQKFTWLDAAVVPFTYEECLNDAKKCETLTEFYKKYRRSCCRAQSKGWIDDYVWLVPQDYDDDLCIEIAKSCYGASELELKYPWIYRYVVKSGLIKTFDWFKSTRVNITYYEAYEVAKKYKTSKGFILGDPLVYNRAYSYGWLQDYTWIDNKMNKIYTEKECVDRALKYKRLSDFQTFDREYYWCMIKNGWLRKYPFLF